MGAPSILTSLHGRAFGLGPKGELISNNTAGGLVNAQAVQRSVVRVTIAVPFEVVPAPGLGKTLVCDKMVASKVAGIAFTAGAGEDLAIIPTGGAAFCAIDSGGFLDSVADEIRFAERVPVNPEVLDLTALQNLALEATILVGEVTGGVDLIVEVHYTLYDDLLS